MHDSDNFQWMKPDAAVLSLTGFASSAARTEPLLDANAKTRRPG
jgi:hypothetical protein